MAAEVVKWAKVIKGNRIATIQERVITAASRVFGPIGHQVGKSL